MRCWQQLMRHFTSKIPRVNIVHPEANSIQRVGVFQNGIQEPNTVLSQKATFIQSYLSLVIIDAMILD